MATTPHREQLRVPYNGPVLPGQYGPRPFAVNRALARAGYGTLKDAGRWMGPTQVARVAAFQRANGIRPASGLYGPKTHAKLAPHYDDYSRLLYLAPKKPQADFLLPAEFTPTHETAGLPGYPAVDVFAKPGARAGAPEAGTVRRISGRDPAKGGVPGGAYGWNVYLTCRSGEYFLAHLATVRWPEGSRVKKADVIGTVCDAAVAGMPSSSSHVHCGKKPAP